MSRTTRSLSSATAHLAGLAIDTGLFRRQRALLSRLLHRSRNTPNIRLSAADRELLSGLENLCDAIADRLDNLPGRPATAPTSPTSRRRQ